jgi:hypothetical protein
LLAQSDGVALSSPGKLDDFLGYLRRGGIIAIDQTQLAQCIFERHSKHSDRVRPKGFLLMLVGGRNRHLRTRTPKHARLLLAASVVMKNA